MCIMVIEKVGKYSNVIFMHIVVLLTTKNMKRKYIGITIIIFLGALVESTTFYQTNFAN